MFKISIADAPTGSGKTTALAKNTITMVNNNKTVVFIQPTKALNRETADRIAEYDASVHIELINGDTCPKGTVTRLAEHLRQPFDQPHVILTTHESFERLPYRTGMERYDLICDEIPKAFKSISERLPHNHGKLTDAITVIPKGPSYGLIEVVDEGKLRRIAENRRGDAVDGILQPFARDILDDNYQTFVNLQQYENLRRGSSVEVYLKLFSLVDPKLYAGFQSVRMAGARASETILYKWLKQLGVEFENDGGVRSQLRYLEHTNGHLMDLYYGSELNWSLYAQERDPEIKQRSIEVAIRLMTGKRFCWLDNKRFEVDHPLLAVEGSIQLPHASHGRNDFQTEDNVILLHAFNYDSTDSSFLENVVGLSRTEQKIAFDYHNTYQTLSRLSVRDPNNNNRKIIVLPDRQNAEWQSQVFPGSSIYSMNVDHRESKKKGRPREHENANERQRAKRKRLENEQDALVEKYDLGIQRMIEAGNQTSCHRMYIDTISNNVTSYQGSVVIKKSEGSSSPLAMSATDFGKYLRGLHKRSFKDKDDNNLIMSALCVPVPKESTQRAETNALFGRHIILDFDNTELKPLTLSRIFRHIEMYCYNSYNHTDEKSRYRVIFLTDDVMTASVYKFLWYQIVQCIENQGYYGFKDRRPKGERKLHGIDNKPNIVTPFYLPCQPKNGKGFFYHYNKNRKPLDVRNWVENPIMTRFGEELLSEDITLTKVQKEIGEHQLVIDRAMKRYRSSINVLNENTNERMCSNDALFNMALFLKGNGVDRFDADMAMTQAANESNSPRDRKGDKNRYLKRFWK